MKTVALDVHADRTQMSVSAENGTILVEKIIETRPEVLRKEIKAIPGPKRVVFENGPMSGLVVDAVKDDAEEIVACDPTRNRLIATADDSNDKRDARRLGTLGRTGGLHPVFVPNEPYRTLRSLVSHELRMTRLVVESKLKIKALCRRHAVRYRARGPYTKEGRARVLEELPTTSVRFQMQSHYRMLEVARTERLAVRREIRAIAKPMPLFKRLQSVPGVGPVVAWTFLAWIVDPGRFKSRSALYAYAGLGLKQNFSNWKATGAARASRRGHRGVKRVLFLAARASILRENAFRRRYQARRTAGWEDRKAIRDIARTLLSVTCHVWRTGEEYNDGRINVPDSQGTR